MFVKICIAQFFVHKVIKIYPKNICYNWFFYINSIMCLFNKLNYLICWKLFAQKSLCTFNRHDSCSLKKKKIFIDQTQSATSQKKAVQGLQWLKYFICGYNLIVRYFKISIFRLKKWEIPYNLVPKKNFYINPLLLEFVIAVSRSRKNCFFFAKM